MATVQDWAKRYAVVCSLSAAKLRAGERAVEHCHQWCAGASMAVLCWLWLSRCLGMMKDIRLVTAHLVWESRAEWNRWVFESTH